MAPNELINVLRARPFVPFRMVTSDGTIYEIRHPELVMVALSTAVVGYPNPGMPGGVERYDIVTLRHIVRLEPRPEWMTAPQGGDGQQQG